MGFIIGFIIGTLTGIWMVLNFSKVVLINSNSDGSHWITYDGKIHELVERKSK